MLNKGIIRCMALLMFAGMAGCQPDLPQASKTSGLPIKIARSYWPGTYWIDIADKKGWFAEASLNVELIDITADYVGSIDKTVARKIDTNSFTLFDLVKFNAKGAGLVMVRL